VEIGGELGQRKEIDGRQGKERRIRWEPGTGDRDGDEAEGIGDGK
jgi:hypothetical protein